MKTNAAFCPSFDDYKRIMPNVSVICDVSELLHKSVIEAEYSNTLDKEWPRGLTGACSLT